MTTYSVMGGAKQRRRKWVGWVGWVGNVGICTRGVSGGWAGWAIAHPVFGRIEGTAGRRRGGSGASHYYLPTQF